MQRDLGSEGKALPARAARMGHWCWTAWGEVGPDCPSRPLLDAGVVDGRGPGGSSVLQSLFPESKIAVRSSARPPPQPQPRLLKPDERRAQLSSCTHTPHAAEVKEVKGTVQNIKEDEAGL